MADPTVLRVMSYNVQGGAIRKRRDHLEQIASVVQDAKVDVAALQEVHRGTIRSGKTDQLEALSQLTGMESAFGRSSHPAGGGEFGNGLLTRLPLLWERTHPLPGGGESRSVLETELVANETRIHLFVTHLTAWGPFGRRNRRRQTASLATMVESSRLPFILAGDFNTTPSSRELAPFRGGKLVMSCFPENAVTYRSTRQCLDYVFIDPRCSFRDAQVLKAGPSDHWPLVVEVVLPSQ